MEGATDTHGARTSHPFTRRSVAAGLTSAAAIGALLSRAPLRTPPGSASVDDERPNPVAPARPITVALPVGGDLNTAYHDELVTAAVRRAAAPPPADPSSTVTRARVTVLAIDRGRGSSTFADTVATLLASGKAPDIVLLTGTWAAGTPHAEFANAVTSGWLRPLDSHLRQNQTLTLTDFYEPALAVSRHRGQLYGVPIQSAPMLLIYDRPRLWEAGLDDLAGPAGEVVPWSWQQLADAAARLTRDRDRDGHAKQVGFYASQTPGALLSFIWQNGGDVVSADLRRALLAEPPALEAMQFFASLYRRVPPVALPSQPSWTWTWGKDGLVMDNLWRVVTTFQSLGAMRDLRGGALAGAELPAGKHQAAPVGVRATLALTAASKHPDEAAAALFGLADGASRQVGLPARRQPVAALEALDARANPPMDPRLVHQIASAVTKTLEYGRASVLDDLGQTLKVHDVLAGLVRQLQDPTTDLARAAEQANREIDRLIDSR